MPASQLSSAPLTEHGMLTQDGQEDERCDEALKDLVGDSSSLLGSQAGSSFEALPPQTAPLASASLTQRDTTGAEVQEADAVRDPCGQSGGWSDPWNPPVSHSGRRELHQRLAADPMEYSSQAMSCGQSGEVALRTIESVEDQRSEVADMTAGTQGTLNMHALEGSDDPWSSPKSQEAVSSFQAPQPQTAPLASASLTAAAGAEVQVALNDTADLLEEKEADAVRDPWGQSGGWSDPWNPPVSHSGRRELHQRPAADPMEYSSQVMSSKQQTKGSALTAGSYDAWDVDAPRASDNPWSSSPLAQEVMRGKKSHWPPLRAAESDDDNVSEVSALPAGAQGVLDNTATAPSDNPWSSPVPQKAGWSSQALQPQTALVPSAVALEARLQAVSAEKEQLQRQLTCTLRLLQKARTDLWTSQDACSELEWQSAYEYWTSRPSLRPQGDCSSLLPAHTSRLASPEQDLWARRRYKASTGQDKVGDWQWVTSDFSSTAQILAPSEAGAAIFGTGANGRVFCGKLVLDGSQVVPAAFKRVAFDTAAQRTKAKAELAALKDLADGPHSLQCYGAFDYRCPQDGKRYLQIAMECVHGISYRELSLPVLESKSADRRYTFGITVVKRMLEALSWPHAQGRAHCDLKTDNMAFCMDGETGELSRIQLMDHGGSLNFAGQFGRAPPGFTCNKLSVSPEVTRGILGDSCVHIDGCAHDCWGVGCIGFLAFSNIWPFYCRPTGDSPHDYRNIRDNHRHWAESYHAPDPLQSHAHPLLGELHTSLGDWKRYLAVATLLRSLLHPDIGARATVQDALASELFA
ncbi:hypothetical protein ABBQ32_013244 [Trebouxia sp. C0010 RCD-2024]